MPGPKVGGEHTGRRADRLPTVGANRVPRVLLRDGLRKLRRGGQRAGVFRHGESKEEAFLLLDRAVDLGINFLDTADAYGGGRSEATIGEWLRTKTAGVRDDLLISSKVGNAVGDDPEARGLSRRHIVGQVDASLTALGIDHLDMYLIHEPDPDTPLSELKKAYLGR